MARSADFLGGAHPAEEEVLEEALQRHSGKLVRLTITDNTSSMLTCRKDDAGVYDVRAHHMFLGAPEEVLAEMGRWLRGTGGRSRAIQRFIDEQRHLIRPKPGRRRRTLLRPKGIFHDLDEVLGEVGERYFRPPPEVHISWGKRTRAGARSITLGSYRKDKNLITINPRLDTRETPRFFVAFVIYHELLHLMLEQRHPAQGHYHTDEFHAFERRFERYEEAMVWEREHIQGLLR